MGLIKMIQDFINAEYRYTGTQVKEAFTLAVKRELYLDGKRVDPSTFGQHLSVNVVGQVLTAYKEIHTSLMSETNDTVFLKNISEIFASIPALSDENDKEQLEGLGKLAATLQKTSAAQGFGVF